MSNGRYTVVEIRCDHEEDSGDCGNTEDDIGVSVATLRKWAKGRGWRCDKSGDWCPVHAEVSP